MLLSIFDKPDLIGRSPQAGEQAPGFSLVEVLIALALMGVLAAFTIPPLFTTSMSGASAKYTQSAQNSAFMIVAAYEQYRIANGSVPATAKFSALTPYLSYVKTDSSSTLNKTDGSSFVCGTSGLSCLSLHNGSYLYYGTTVSFSGTNTTNGIWLGFDPDGTHNNQPSLGMVLTYDGRIQTYGTITTTYYYNSIATISPGASDPTWFQGF